MNSGSFMNGCLNTFINFLLKVSHSIFGGDFSEPYLKRSGFSYVSVSLSFSNEWTFFGRFSLIKNALLVWCI